MSNAERARRYRERIKADPEKALAWRNKAASRMRKKRSVAQQKPMGGKHAAPKTGLYLDRSDEARVKEQDALIEEYREHHAKQANVAPRITPEQRAALLAAFDDPVPLADYPHLKAIQERIPVKELPPKA